MLKKNIFLIVSLCFLTACNSESSVPEGDASRAVKFEIRGRGYAPDALSISETEFVWAQQVVSNYRRVKKDDFPAEVKTIPVAGCKFPHSDEDGKIMHAQIGSGVQESPIYEISQKDLVSRTKRMLEAKNANLTRSQLRSFIIESRYDSMEVVNVVVTEREQPVHLVLSSTGKIIWNIQAHPQADIRRISMISNYPVGIVNAPESAKILALAGHATLSCGAQPLRMPNDMWSLVSNAKSGRHNHLKEVVLDNRNYALKFRAWFMESFGVSPFINVAGAYVVSNVLLGPLPTAEEDKIPYKTLANATLYMSKTDHFFTKGEKHYEVNILHRAAQLLKRSGAEDMANILLDK